MTISRFDAFAITAAVVVAAVLMCLPAGAQDVPPVTGLACSPSTHAIAGCERVWLPYLAVTQVTGEGGSGILPVRSAP